MAEENQTKLRDLIKDAHVGLLTTIDAGGSIVSRPMALQTVEFDGDLWFFTSANSNKVAEINAEPAVNVAFQSKDAWVSVSGTAAIVTDKSKAEELWNPVVKAYFPDGLEDPELRLIRVDASSAEYWDSDNKLVSLFKMAKAVASHDTPDLGDNKTVQL